MASAADDDVDAGDAPEVETKGETDSKGPKKRFEVKKVGECFADRLALLAC